MQESLSETRASAVSVEAANDTPMRIGVTPSPMRVLEIGVYRGPHLYGHTPMVRLQLDLGTLEAWPTGRLPGFVDRLVALLPGLQSHGCSYGTPGGFLRRMGESTWLGHVIEHVTIELQQLAGAPVTRGKTRSVAGQSGVYNILVAYEDEIVALAAMRCAIQLVNALLPEELRGVERLDRIGNGRDLPSIADPADIDAVVAALRRLRARHALGPTTRALVEAARERGIPVLRLDEHSLIQLGYGKYQQLLRASITGRTASLAVEAAGDKQLARRLLADAGLPVPEGEVVRDADEAVAVAQRIGFPVVTKPLDANHGRGVTLDLHDDEAVRRGFADAARYRSRVIVERQLTGRDHRILVVDGKIVAVAERVPAHVVGDGASSIATLIEAVNADPRRGDGHETALTRIVIDAHVEQLLAKAGRTLDSIPAAGEVVLLRDTANLSTGGTAIDRTDEIHPENAAIARRAARVIGLDIAGIDFLAPDIARSVRETGGGIIEINAAPGFRMHLEPSEGRPRNVAVPVVQMLFPADRPSRIPIFAITGTNGKSTTTRMLTHILRSSGLIVGTTSTSGIYLDGERLVAVDAAGPKSARMVLRDPLVEAAVLETARGGILREGLAFDWCDVGAVLNVEADHLGLKGVQTVDDLAWVKSVVVEAVAPHGISVLNADDLRTQRMARRAGGRICWFSLRGAADMPDFLRRHVEEGGLAVVREPSLDGGRVVLHRGGERTVLMDAAAIPATLQGLADFNVQNALAAIGMAAGYGIGLPAIRNAMASFDSSFATNPGRLNMHDAHGFRVIVDYAHNPASLRALCGVVRKLRPHYKRTIGMISIPGDRRDEDIREMGVIAAQEFDELVFRERPDGRGRAPGTINALLTEAAIEAGFAAERIHSLPDEHMATQYCLGAARPDDLVVLTPTNYEEIWAELLAWSPDRPMPLARRAAAVAELQPHA